MVPRPDPANPDGPAPTVSVIVAVHDVAAQVGAAIESLRAQELTDFEALVVDDGSCDGSGQVAEAAFGGDPRFRLIRQENRGLSGARNAGLAQARGRWVAFLDGDDRLAPGFLSQLIGAAEAAGQPWAACAVMLCHDDGTEVPHSAIHGSPDPAGQTARLIALTDATEVARLYPSAWNKVFRQDLIADTRFPEGTWFEDHEVWWRLADRARTIAYVPVPLYLHSRGRPGQITGADDERVFDQFAVLDRLCPLVARFDQAEAGMARLASRLIHERAQVVRDKDRRTRFLARARSWFEGTGMGYTTAGGADLSPALGLTLSGLAPLTILGAGQPVPPGRLDAETIMPDGRSLEQIAQATRGRYLLVLPEGAAPLDDAMVALLDAALRADAPLALGQLLTPAGHHDGWMDNRLAPAGPGLLHPLQPGAALRLHPSTARMLIHRDLLARIGELSTPLDHPLAGAELLLRAALHAERALLLPESVARIASVPGVGATRAIDWAQGLRSDVFADMPPGWRTVLALRALRPSLAPVRSAAGIAARLGIGLALWRRGMLAPAGAVPADPGTDRLLASLAGVPLSPD